MPCTPRTVDGRTTAENVVYHKNGKEIGIPLGKPADVRIPKKDLVKNFRGVSEEDLTNFPDEVHVVMTKDRITISDVFKKKETTAAEFYKDEIGWKMVKAYDELAIWMAFFRGLMKNQINITIFYDSRVREELYK